MRRGMNSVPITMSPIQVVVPRKPMAWKGPFGQSPPTHSTRVASSVMVPRDFTSITYFVLSKDLSSPETWKPPPFTCSVTSAASAAVIEVFSRASTARATLVTHSCRLLRMLIPSTLKP
jgi:hypothetical protein